MSSFDECGLQNGSCFGLPDSDGSDSGSENPTGVSVDSIGIVMLSRPESVKEQLPDDESNVPEDKEFFHTTTESRWTPTPNDPVEENNQRKGASTSSADQGVEENNQRKGASTSSADQGVEGDEKAKEGTEGTKSESSSSKSSGVVAELNESSLPSPADVNVGDDDRADGFVGSGKKVGRFTVFEVLRQLAANREEDMSIYSKSLLEVAEERWGPFGSTCRGKKT